MTKSNVIIIIIIGSLHNWYYIVNNSRDESLEDEKVFESYKGEYGLYIEENSGFFKKKTLI